MGNAVPLLVMDTTQSDSGVVLYRRGRYLPLSCAGRTRLRGILVFLWSCNLYTRSAAPTVCVCIWVCVWGFAVSMHALQSYPGLCLQWLSEVIRHKRGVWRGLCACPKKERDGLPLIKERKKKKQKPRLSSLRKVYVKQEGLKAITVIHGRSPCATKATYVERPS